MGNQYGLAPVISRALIVVGMCNPESHVQKNNLHPIPFGSAGHNLYQLFRNSGQRGANEFTRAEYIMVTERIGLCPGDEADLKTGERRGLELQRQGFFDRPTLLCGREVAECVLPLTKWGGCPARYNQFFYIPSLNSANKFFENRMKYLEVSKFCGLALAAACKDMANKIYNPQGVYFISSDDEKPDELVKAEQPHDGK